MVSTSQECLSKYIHSLYLYVHVKRVFSQASADKIIREMELFGQDFERYEEVQAEIQRVAEAEEVKENEKDATLDDKSKAKKGKLVAKSTGLTYQFQIMESIGVPRTDIKKFADPLHWLTYFPPIAVVRHFFLWIIFLH